MAAAKLNATVLTSQATLKGSPYMPASCRPTDAGELSPYRCRRAERIATFERLSSVQPTVRLLGRLDSHRLRSSVCSRARPRVARIDDKGRLLLGPPRVLLRFS